MVLGCKPLQSLSQCQYCHSSLSLLRHLPDWMLVPLSNHSYGSGCKLLKFLFITCVPNCSWYAYPLLLFLLFIFSSTCCLCFIRISPISTFTSSVFLLHLHSFIISFLRCSCNFTLILQFVPRSHYFFSPIISPPRCNRNFWHCIYICGWVAWWLPLLLSHTGLILFMSASPSAPTLREDLPGAACVCDLLMGQTRWLWCFVDMCFIKVECAVI